MQINDIFDNQLIISKCMRTINNALERLRLWNQLSYIIKG